MKNVGRWETNQTEENAADKITDGRGKDENISKEVEDAMRPRPSTRAFTVPEAVSLFEKTQNEVGHIAAGFVTIHSELSILSKFRITLNIPQCIRCLCQLTDLLGKII